MNAFFFFISFFCSGFISLFHFFVSNSVLSDTLFYPIILVEAIDTLGVGCFFCK